MPPAMAGMPALARINCCCWSGRANDSTVLSPCGFSTRPTSTAGGTHLFNEQVGFGQPNFIRRQDVLDGPQGFLRFGVATIRAEVEVLR